jgi:hypothetical protein
MIIQGIAARKSYIFSGFYTWFLDYSAYEQNIEILP